MFHYRMSAQNTIKNLAWHRMNDYLRRAGLQAAGPLEQVMLANLRLEGETIHCGWFSIPIGENEL